MQIFRIFLRVIHLIRGQYINLCSDICISDYRFHNRGTAIFAIGTPTFNVPLNK